jgi:hypothetical protein
MSTVILQESARIGHPILGFIIPALIFGISFAVAWALYRHFTQKIDD